MNHVDYSQPAEGELHFGKIALKLGLVSSEQLQMTLDAQEELKAAGVHTLIGDVMRDLELITSEQCEQALTEQDHRLRIAGLRGRVRGAPTVGWVVAGMVPVLGHMPPVGVLAWSGAILLGIALAHTGGLRWVGLAWITSVAVPTSTPAAIAGSGSLLGSSRMHVGAVLLGGTLGLLPLPETLHHAGPLLLTAAAFLAFFPRVR